MTDREIDELAEIMARGVEGSAWETMTYHSRLAAVLNQHNAIVAATRAGWRFLPPVDGR